MFLRSLTSHGGSPGTAAIWGETLGQVSLRSHQASSLQGQPQLWSYRAFARAGTVPAWHVVNDTVPFNSQPPLQQFFFRQMHTESFSTPTVSFLPPSFLPPPLILLSFCFPSSSFCLPLHESWYKFQSKIKMYFISPFRLWLSSVHSKDVAVSMGTNTL